MKIQASLLLVLMSVSMACSKGSNPNAAAAAAPTPKPEVNEAGCPILTGEWVCTDNEGVTSTEKIVTTGNKYEITQMVKNTDGVMEERKDVYIADGKEETRITSEVVSTTLDKSIKKIAELLPKDNQAAFLKSVEGLKWDTSKFVNVKSKMSCNNGVLNMAATFSLKMNIPLVIELDAMGTVIGSEKMVDGKRQSLGIANGELTSKLSKAWSLLSKDAGETKKSSFNVSNPDSCVRK